LAFNEIVVSGWTASAASWAKTANGASSASPVEISLWRMSFSLLEVLYSIPGTT
jgi:hypothetical protein